MGADVSSPICAFYNIVSYELVSRFHTNVHIMSIIFEVCTFKRDSFNYFIGRCR